MEKIITDLAIVAAGPAGLCASVAAAEAGVQVTVFEKSSIAGGTANMGMGPFGVESRIATGLRGADAVLDLVRGINAEHADEPTTLMLVGHGSWHVATIETLLGMDPDNLSNLDGMRNAFWSTLRPVYRPSGGVEWMMTAFNQGPAVAALCDWENGPQSLHGPHMPMWKPIER